ncbi:monocarboxylate transporter 12-like isoform X2 [Homarus americanus]|uniref:monocarboxylate transporter 12-like isoform X2 n=1 Tax=Homarus americanus TaxID=6706 RepID=UPI001C46030D|nr:monocarboxylate transporter 12-like isoform X2 [Homarus americanus]
MTSALGETMANHQETTVSLKDEGGHSIPGHASLNEHTTKGDGLEDTELLNDRKNVSTDEDGQRDTGRSCLRGSGVAVADGEKWTVALGVFIILTMTNMVGLCFGIIFSPFLLSLGTSSTTVAWIFNSLLLLWFTSGLFLGPLVEEFGWMKIALVFSFVYSCSIVLSAFATSAWFLIFSFSIMGGISGGLLNALCFLIIPHYFTRRKGVANACAMSGVGTGQIAGSIIIGFLQEEFAFFGATVILGAATLHCFVGTFLLSPVQRHENGPEAGADKVNKKRCHISGNAFLRVFRSSVANLTILKSSRAAILAVGGMFTVNSHLSFISLIPFAIQAAGHSLRAASLCVTVSAVASMVTRCAVSTLTDWPWFSIRVCQMASTTTIVISTVGTWVILKRTSLFLNG